jgi:hypothetical protein
VRRFPGENNPQNSSGAQMGATRSGRSFRTLPRSLPTGHAFISSAGNGLNGSTGRVRWVRWFEPSYAVFPMENDRRPVGQWLHLFVRVRGRDGVGFHGLTRCRVLPALPQAGKRKQ